MTDSRHSRGTVAVAMSGGVDSSVVAALLREAGHDVIGLTAILTPGASRCCSDEDVARAREVCAQLGVPHETVDVRDAFQREIVADFGAEYLAGRTPSPCVRCNSRIKFGPLLEAAARLGADRMATGHYARLTEDGDGRRRLFRGADGVKDQSYFLARLDQSQLRRALFPLGGMVKAEVVRLAHDRRLASRDSRESQDVCFVNDTDHGTWIDVRWLRTPGPGDIVDRDGRKVGRHEGIHRYTVGQRKGLGVALGKPVYVIAIDAARNVVVVGEHDAALGRELWVRDAAWLAGAAPAERFDASVQIRYRHAAAPASVVCDAGGGARVTFADPQFGIAPGQQAAFYVGDELLGGGWIEGQG